MRLTHSEFMTNITISQTLKLSLVSLCSFSRKHRDCCRAWTSMALANVNGWNENEITLVNCWVSVRQSKNGKCYVFWSLSNLIRPHSCWWLSVHFNAISKHFAAVCIHRIQTCAKCHIYKYDLSWFRASWPIFVSN